MYEWERAEAGLGYQLGISYCPQSQGILSYQQLPAGNIASSTLPSKAHRVIVRLLPRPSPSCVPALLLLDLGAPRATALGLLAHGDHACFVLEMQVFR